MMEEDMQGVMRRILFALADYDEFDMNTMIEATDLSRETIVTAFENFRANAEKLKIRKAKGKDVFTDGAHDGAPPRGKGPFGAGLHGEFDLGPRKSRAIEPNPEDPAGLCVTGDTLLMLKDGREIPIVRIKAGDYVLSLNEVTQEIEPHRVNGLLDMGVKPVFRLTTASGRSIKTTANHPYLTRSGWVKVSGLKTGERIAVPIESVWGVSCRDIQKEFPLLPQSAQQSASSYSTSLFRVEPETREHQYKKSDPASKTDNYRKTAEEITCKPNSEDRFCQISKKAGNMLLALCDIILHRLKDSIVPVICQGKDVLCDVLWDHILFIEYLGYEHVYDIEVDGTHNFIGNRIFAHNTHISAPIVIPPVAAAKADATLEGPAGAAVTVHKAQDEVATNVEETAILREKALERAKPYLLSGEKCDEFLNSKVLSDDPEKRREFIREVVDIYRLEGLVTEVEIKRELLKIYLLSHIPSITSAASDKRRMNNIKLATEMIEELLADARPYVFQPLLDLIIDEMARCEFHHKPVFVEKYYQIFKDTAHLPRFAKAIVAELVRAEYHEIEPVHDVTFDSILKEIIFILGRILSDYPNLRPDIMDALKGADLSRLSTNAQAALSQIVNAGPRTAAVNDETRWGANLADTMKLCGDKIQKAERDKNGVDKNGDSAHLSDARPAAKITPASKLEGKLPPGYDTVAGTPLGDADKLRIAEEAAKAEAEETNPPAAAQAESRGKADAKLSEKKLLKIIGHQARMRECIAQSVEQLKLMSAFYHKKCPPVCQEVIDLHEKASVLRGKISVEEIDIDELRKIVLAIHEIFIAIYDKIDAFREELIKEMGFEPARVDEDMAKWRALFVEYEKLSDARPAAKITPASRVNLPPSADIEAGTPLKPEDRRKIAEAAMQTQAEAEARVMEIQRTEALLKKIEERAIPEPGAGRYTESKRILNFTDSVFNLLATCGMFNGHTLIYPATGLDVLPARYAPTIVVNKEDIELLSINASRTFRFPVRDGFLRFVAADASSRNPEHQSGDQNAIADMHHFQPAEVPKRPTQYNPEGDEPHS